MRCPATASTWPPTSWRARSSAKEVTAGRRLYGLIGEDLGWAYDMAAVGQPLQSHISAQLKRVG